MPQRLPILGKSTDSGTIYVLRRDNAYKIGFSRHIARRIKRLGGELVLTIQTGQRPSQLEYAIMRRFSHKVLRGYNNSPGGRREWFALDGQDIAWLQGLAHHVTQS